VAPAVFAISGQSLSPNVQHAMRSSGFHSRRNAPPPPCEVYGR
jgi:hypothetical protein